jgi:anti-anti-sigma regulatory factor
MDEISVDYFFQSDKGKRFIYLKIRAVKCSMPQFIQIFSEIGESLISTSYENVCIDLSSLSLVSSMVFGACINIVSVAKKNNKHLKFKFNSVSMETARLSAFDSFVDIEEGQE